MTGGVAGLATGFRKFKLFKKLGRKISHATCHTASKKIGVNRQYEEIGVNREIEITKLSSWEKVLSHAPYCHHFFKYFFMVLEKTYKTLKQIIII